MSTNYQKTPFIQSLAKAAKNQAEAVDWNTGKSYPCIVEEVVSPGVVMVNFQVTNQPFTLHQIKMPVAKPPYVQYPIKKGDKGVAMSADLSLGAMSGLGGGNPNPQVPTGNLSNLHFVWLGHLDEEFIDPDALTLYGNVVCTPDMLAFFGEDKVAKQTLSAAATDLGSAIMLVNSIRDALIAYGLAE